MIVIREIADLLQATRQVLARYDYQIWWRGQGSKGWPLIPKVHRLPAHDVYEANIAIKFMQLAPTRHPKCPAPEELSQWLFLAQHYGLPTRLLDWSESPLVALYFAVADDSSLDQTGAIWALDPLTLNAVTLQVPILCSSDDPAVDKLVRGAFSHQKANEDAVLAVLPTEVDIRMMMQLAGFTIHGSARPLEKLPRSKSFLSRFTIPAKAKLNLRSELASLGIRERNIFPDLHHLSQELARGSMIR